MVAEITDVHFSVEEPAQKEHKIGTGKKAAKKTPRKKPRTPVTNVKARNTKGKRSVPCARKEYKPKLTIIRPGQEPCDSIQDEPGLPFDVDFVETEPETQSDPELTQAEICDLLEMVADPETAEESQPAILSKLGKVLDAGGAWLQVKSPKKGRRQITVREYLMTELLHLRDKHGKLRTLYLNRAQKDYHSNCGKRSIVLKARQLGITTYVAARFFLNCITRPGTLAVQVAHDQRSAEEIFRIVHRMLENLPEPLRKGALKTSRANVRQIVFPARDSEYRVETAADPNAGRGLTIQNLHCSEVARWPRDIAETLASLRAAVPPDGEIVLESTPDGAWGPFYEEWQRAVETGYTRHFYPWWWEPNYVRKKPVERLTEIEQELIDRHGLTHEQIAFRREVRANFGSRAQAEYAEDAEKCFLVSGECFFDVEIVHQQMRHAPDPVVCSDADRYQQWLLPVMGEAGTEAKEYIIGADPAGGGSAGDYSCAQVIERQTGIQCAEYHGHLTPIEFAHRLAQIAREYNHALIAVERNNHGTAVLTALHMGTAYDHVYRQGTVDGWLTSEMSRSWMLEKLRDLVANHPDAFKSKRFLQECRTFVRRPDGKCAAGRAAHDDTVMAMAIAQIVRSEMPPKPVWARPTVEVEPSQPIHMFAAHGQM